MTTNGMRAKFEAWAQAKGHKLRRSYPFPHLYQDVNTHEAYEAWRAGCASRDAEIAELRSTVNMQQDTIGAGKRKLALVHTEVEALRKDADRYRHWREMDGGAIYAITFDCDGIHPEKLDAAIDADMPKDNPMTDRELLEAAAKAAGYDTSHPMNRERLTLDPPVDALWISKHGELVHTGWDPLKDDGGAFRLAVELSLCIDRPHPGDGETWVQVSDSRGDVITYEDFDDDPYAATRRAIVRAAAAIGGAM